jgi:hypothetical protein
VTRWLSALLFPTLALLLVLVACGLTGCATVVMVVVDRPGCASTRSVTVTRQAGQPAQTKVDSRRTCGAAKEGGLPL